MAYHNHAHHQHRRDRVGDPHQKVRRQETVFNVVYVTASPTFTGKVSLFGALSTLSQTFLDLQLNAYPKAEKLTSNFTIDRWIHDNGWL